MSRRSDARGDAAGSGSGRGQATVELAILLPVIAVVVLAVVQVGLIVHARVMVTHAAREGVRVAAVGGSDGDVARAVMVAGDLSPDRVAVTVERSGGRAVVRVEYVAATDVPLVGSLLDAVTLSARATMRLE